MKPTLMAVALGACLVPLYAQSTEPPAVITITREAIKEGKGAAHRRVEKDYANAFRKNNFPFHYVALSSMSGPSEVWFLSGYPSFAAVEEGDKASDKAPLKNDLELVEARDGELRASSRGMTAVYRKDLSYQSEAPITVGKSRYWMISTYRVRLGKGEDFMAGSKMILGAYSKVKAPTSVYCFQVIAGAPEGTYLFMEPMDSLKTLDEEPAREKALMDAVGQDNFNRLMKGTGDVFQTMEMALFSVSPDMSYVPKATEDADPTFWKPKPAAPAAPKPKEKTGQ